MDLKDLVLQTLDEVAQDSGAGDSGEQVFGVESGSVGVRDQIRESGQMHEPSQAHADSQAGLRSSALSNQSLDSSGDDFGRSGLDSGRGSVPKSSAPHTSTSKPKLPKTSIESSPTKAGKIISPAQAEASLSRDHKMLLEDLREKLLVLFEGLKMPELQDTPNKLDLVVRFLQYQLCVIDELLDKPDSM